MKKRVVVLHSYYGCDSGCCGHVVQVDGKQVGDFSFSHPGDDDFLQFAKDLVTEQYGPEHVADLDWQRSQISDD